jgi:hypothetical protein
VALTKALLLFAMNWLDAQLTILWLRLDVATEGNVLMAHLIKHSEGSFLSVKLIIGALAGYTLYRCSELPIARRGMALVLGIYLVLLGIHVATAVTALGWEAPATVLTYFVSLPSAFLALFC